MKEQWINDTCMMFARSFDNIDVSTVRNILTVALCDCDITKYSKAVALTDGDTNEKYIQLFIVSKKVGGASDRTVKYYAFILKKFFEKTGIRADECTSNHVKVYLAKRELEDHVSAVTRNNERSALCSFFQWMMEEELISKNPMVKVKPIKTPKVQKKAFTAMELEKIRSKCKDEKESAVIEVLISTGCRVSELCGMKLNDISDNTIIVHGKGNKDRTCFLTAKAKYAIDVYLGSDAYNRRRVDGNHYLFNGEAEKPIRPNSIEQMVRNIGEEAGISKCHPHRFRRTCATMALDRGMPIEKVSKMLGHESIGTTQVYLDINTNDIKEAHEKYVC